MPFLESLSLSSIGKIISAIWANGSRFLWSVALAAAMAAAVLWLGVRYELPKAQLWWGEYGLLLVVAAAVVAVFALFKLMAERHSANKLFLIADEQQSLWHHAKQQDDSITTQFSLKFSATNRAAHHLILSKVRVLRPWVWRRRVLSAMVATEGVNGMFSRHNSVPPRGRRECQASVMVKGEIGGHNRTKPMHVKIGLQDNLGKWHKLVFVDLRDPQFRR
jgi:hypothetical protein